ncbi:hypothetical protein EON83_21845 [bacterium]|nr:MAG: hypothetical protein EON83_21845 [bacterium]
MASSSQHVIIRAQRVQYFGCCGGCLGSLIIGVAIGTQAVLAFRSRFSPSLIWSAIGVLLVLAVALLWFFYFDINIQRVWNQRFTFEADSVRFKDEKIEQQLAYSQIVAVQVEQVPPGPSHNIVFQCRDNPLQSIICTAHDFSPEAVMKILAQLCRRAGLDSVEISRLPDTDNESDLRTAAKGFGEITLDKTRNCYLFTLLTS